MDASNGGPGADGAAAQRKAAERQASDTLPRVQAAVVAERVGDRVVVVHLESNQIFELNDTAARLFELLRAGTARSEIESTMLAEFDVDRETLARQFDALLARLREHEIVE